MANMADITVKNVAGTDVVYSAATPSAGDKVPARWLANASSGVQGLRPRLDLLTQSNAAGDVRRAEFAYTFPVSYTDDVTGASRLLAPIKATATVFLPMQLSTDQWEEAFTQFGNLLVSTLIRSSIEQGYAPT